MSQEQSSTSKFLPIVLFGVLSVVFAEVFSGSAPLWFTDGWGLFVVLPLYWIHALFLLNLAMRYKRTSLAQLYLWGVIFGLYEGWITKVLWAGYMGDAGPAFGSILGFAIAEFMVIALFWHAIFSFIVPILIFEIIIISSRETSANMELLSNHHKYLVSNRRNKIGLLLVFITGSFFVLMGLEANVAAIGIAAIGNMMIIWIFLWLSTRSKETELSLSSIRLGKRGLAVTATYLILLNGILFFILLPERIPPIETLLLTIGFYAIVLLLLYLSPASELDTLQEPATSLFSVQTLKNAFIVFSFLIILWLFILELAIVVATLFYLGFILLGPILFIYSVIWVAKSRMKSSSANRESLD
ncbi:MAG: hypothetical protein ACTSUO_02925 [Candidatus Thorarchaeota archaeon]